ncbi:MAG: rod shape-determining protein MreC [Verrucomicrobiota bacterium]
MLKRQHYIALGLVVLFALILLTLHGQTASRVKLAISGLFLPLFGLAGSSHQLADQAGASMTSRAQLQKENDALRRENQQHRIESLQAAEIARENARLREQLGWQQKAPWKLKLARVVLREPANWWRTVQIDVGSRDGARPNLPVLTSDGLVGRISSVNIDSSQVVLVGDPECKVGAMIENDAHDCGVIELAGPFDSSLLTVDYLPRDAGVKPGQRVVTSGLGKVFPRGIPIGTVVDSRTVEYGLFTEARIRLAANLGGLDMVWVLFPTPPNPGTP